MKIAVVLFSILALGATKYPTDYDDFDLNRLEDKRYLLELIKCYIDEGPCDDVGTFFKKYMASAIQTLCIECSGIQKHLLKVFYEKATAAYPEETKKFNQKYDPEQIYFKGLIAILSNY